jgi:WD40 repeat protein
MSGDGSAARQSPFVGLRSFGPDDAGFFFGRARESATLAGALLGNALTVLFGPPGGGKTSLIRVTVAAQLSAATEGQAKIIYWSRWQAGFLPGLKSEVGNALGRSGALHEMVAAHVASGNAPVFLLFDQFEEYFRYAEDPVRTEFAESLALIVNDRALDAHVLMAVREDALSLLDRLRVRLPNILGNTIELRLLDRPSAREAILSPLARWRGQGWPGPAAEPGEALVTALLDQTDQASLRAGSVGAAAAEADTRGRIETAFLQLALQRLWDTELAANSPALRLETLNGAALGGVRGIVEAHLHEALGQFSQDQRQWLALMFRYLVTPSGGKQANSAADLFTSLRDEGRKPPPATVLGEILERLASGDRRILRTLPNVRTPNEGPLFELFHDALAQPVLAWTQGERAAELRRQADTARLQADKARSQARLARVAVVVLASLLVAVVVAGLIARGAMNETTARSQAVLLAQSRFLTREGQAALQGGFPERSYLVETQAAERLKASALSIDRELAEALNRSTTAASAVFLEGHGKRITSVAFSHDGTMAITGSEDGTARLWDLTGPTPVAKVLKGHQKAVNRVAFSRDATRAITASDDNTALVWDLATLKSVATLIAEQRPIYGVALSDDGKHAITKSNDSLRVWDLTASTPTAHLLEDDERNLDKDRDIKGWVYSRDATRAITESRDKTIRVWDLTGPKPVATALPLDKDAVTYAGLSEDGKHVVVASGDNTAVVVWDVTVRPPREIVLKGHKDKISAVGFSDNGERAITCSADKTARVWDLKEPAPAGLVLDGRGEALECMNLSDDGKRAVTASISTGKAIIKVWDLTPPVPAAAQLEGISSFFFSPDGTRAITNGGYNGNAARLWNVTALRNQEALQRLAEAELRRRWAARASIVVDADDPDRPGCLSEAELLDLFLIAPPRDHAPSTERRAPSETGPACPAKGVEQRQAGIWGYVQQCLRMLSLGIAPGSATADTPAPDAGGMTARAGVR